MSNNDKSLRDQVLAAIPAASHTGILKMALDQNINDPNDPHWGMVALAWASTEAAGLARASLEQVRQETAKIPEAIYQNTLKAATDLKATVGQEVRTAGVEVGQALTLAIGQAMTQGAAGLKSAAEELPALAQKKQKEIVGIWCASLAEAVKFEARGTLAGRMARSWGVVVLSLLFAAALGAGAALVGARMSGHLTPWSYKLQYGPSGRVQCGTLRGATYRVCLVQ